MRYATIPECVPIILTKRPIRKEKSKSASDIARDFDIFLLAAIHGNLATLFLVLFK
jgi:hypothetical protein